VRSPLPSTAGCAWLPAMTGQNFALVLVAAIAALIAYLQWVTAHQKIVLELFDKRLEAFRGIQTAIVPIMRNGAATQEEFFAFAAAVERCRFLFGDDVHQYLADLRTKLSFSCLPAKPWKMIWKRTKFSAASLHLPCSRARRRSTPQAIDNLRDWPICGIMAHVHPRNPNAARHRNRRPALR
jgi:hypothetical protein